MSRVIGPDPRTKDRDSESRGKKNTTRDPRSSGISRRCGRDRNNHGFSNLSDMREPRNNNLNVAASNAMRSNVMKRPAENMNEEKENTEDN